MVRRSGAGLVAIVASLAVGTGGCSFIFVRKPTPKVARAPGSCEGRGIAAGADAVLSAFAAYSLVASGGSLLAVEPAGGFSGVKLYESQPWIVRHSEVIWIPVLLAGISSMTYGFVRTSECSDLRAASSREPLPAGAAVPRSDAPGLRTAPTGPAAPAVQQQTDDE
jgi:hypothetical protein